MSTITGYLSELNTQKTTKYVYYTKSVSPIWDQSILENLDNLENSPIAYFANNCPEEIDAVEIVAVYLGSGHLVSGFLEAAYGGTVEEIYDDFQHDTAALGLKKGKDSYDDFINLVSEGFNCVPDGLIVLVFRPVVVTDFDIEDLKLDKINFNKIDLNEIEILIPVISENNVKEIVDIYQKSLPPKNLIKQFVLVSEVIEEMKQKTFDLIEQRPEGEIEIEIVT